MARYTGQRLKNQVHTESQFSDTIKHSKERNTLRDNTDQVEEESRRVITDCS